MDKDQKQLYYRELLLVGIILFMIFTVVFIVYYEPFELIGVPDIDDMLIRMNRENIALFLFVNAAFSFIGSIIIVTALESIILYLLPVNEVKAKLKMKEYNLLAHPGPYSMPANPVYKLIFELECGEERAFNVDPILYATFFEGNKGMLKYKGRVFRKFIEFYVEEVY